MRTRSKSWGVLLGVVALAAAGLVVAKENWSPKKRLAAAPPNRPAVPAWFEDRAEAAGVVFRQGHGGRSPLTLLETIGTGCAVFDADGDGNADIFLVGQEKTGDTGRCALFRNRGDGTFTDITQGSGLADRAGIYIGCAVGDVDNDGRPDLLVTGYGVVRLFCNLGGGRFADVTKGSGLEAPSATDWPTSAAFADVDRDGRLDLYIGRYVVFNKKTIQVCDYGALQSACGPSFYDPQKGSLYRNRGGLRFEDVTRRYGLEGAHGKCLGVVFADVNGDGWPDLYLGNDEMPGDLFLNRNGKRFADASLASGVALAENGQTQGAMGVDFGDYNRDGRPDLLVTTYQFEPTSLYAGIGNQVFEHRSLTAGLDAPTRPLVGFGAKFVDADNDGYPDIAIANGHIHDNQERIDRFSAYRQPMQFFRNEGGERFADRSGEAGPGFTTPGVGRGLAVGDLDNDGREDLVLTDLEGPARVLINRMPRTGNWLRIALRGTRGNRMGLGARITIVAGPKRWETEANTGGSYLSASDARVHVGLGDVRSVDRVEVRWPSGARSVLRAPRVPGDLTIEEPKG